jgi:LmbE family N-acetylglucosaminyl deacetylase
LGLNNGNGEYFKQTGELTEKLKQKIEELNPDIILTFGPDGDTGHNDHRNIGAITTEVLLREGWVEKFPLYYLAWRKKDDQKLKDATGYGLRTVKSIYCNVEFRFSEEDEDKGLASMNCYLSQSTTKERKKWRDVEKADKSNTIYFRQLAISKNKKIGF